jgi:hypothetical protein
MSGAAGTPPASAASVHAKNRFLIETILGAPDRQPLRLRKKQAHAYR